LILKLCCFTLNKFFNKLDFYLIKESWSPFLLVCGAVTGVWFGSDELKNSFLILAGSKSGINLIFSLIFLSLPSTLIFTIPIGILWSSFLVFQRLSNNLEIMAMRASKLSLFQIARPALIFGFLGTISMFILSEFVISKTDFALKQIMKTASYNLPINNSDNGFIFFEKPPHKKRGAYINRVFYARKSFEEENKLQNLIILDFANQQESELNQVTFVPEATWNKNLGFWKLKDGVSYFVSLKDQTRNGVSYFKESNLALGKPIGEIIAKIEKTKYLNAIQYFNYLKRKKVFANLDSKENKQLIFSLYKRLTTPFICVVLALIGSAIGISKERRKTDNISYVYLLLIVLLYYVFDNTLEQMIKYSNASPFLISVVPFFVFGTIGLLLLNRKNQII